MIHRQQHWGLLISAIGAAFGFFSPVLFPFSDAAITNWQITQVGKPSASSAIVVIELAPDGPLNCGIQSWDRLALADLMMELSKAQASVIAPLFPLSGPASPQCGGILGDAKLTESIQHDNVVISANNANFFIQSAKSIGHTNLGLDIDDVLRLAPSTILETDQTVLPWGHVVSQTYKHLTLDRNQANKNHFKTSGWLRWSDQTYTKFSDTKILALKKSNISTLQRIVQDKIVVLVPKEHSRFTINTPFGEKLAAPYAHIEVLQDSLSGNTLKP
ncbi:MAG: CHASE2 domain-containing protein, partial [Nitrospirota bacterium]|nr:CHASE2 domain-containing protein [Nitrospirota bacterium]